MFIVLTHLKENFILQQVLHKASLAKKFSVTDDFLMFSAKIIFCEQFILSTNRNEDILILN